MSFPFAPDDWATVYVGRCWAAVQRGKDPAPMISSVPPKSGLNVRTSSVYIRKSFGPSTVGQLVNAWTELYEDGITVKWLWFVLVNQDGRSPVRNTPWSPGVSSQAVVKGIRCRRAILRSAAGAWGIVGWSSSWPCTSSDRADTFTN